MVQGLTSLGARVAENDDGMTVEGPVQLHSGSVRTFSDHRIAMCFHILARACDIDVHLDDPTCVDISYPDFFSSMESLV